MAEFLARTVQAKLVLTGRSPFPAKATWSDWLVRQDEDSNFDGQIDRSFEGRKQVALPADRSVPDGFEDLGCGDFHSFWARR